MEVDPCTERIVDFIAETTPPEVVRHETRRLLLNSIAAGIPGIAHPTTVAMARFVASTEGDMGCLPLWSSRRYNHHLTPLINTAIVSASQLNETHMPTYTHPLAPVLAALLTEGQLLHTGGSLIDSLALGTEVNIAIAHLLGSSTTSRGFYRAVLSGAIGSAVAVLSLLERYEREAVMALGLAAVSSGGLTSSIGTASSIYTLGSASMLGRDAVRATLSGLDSPSDGVTSMLETYRGFPLDDNPFSTLGAEWQLLHNSFKLHPCDTFAQTMVTCVLDLLLQEEAADGAARFECWLHPAAAVVATARRESFGTRLTAIQARSDPAYCMAATWVAGELTEAQFEQRWLRDDRVLRLRQNIEFHEDDSVPIEGARCRLQVGNRIVECALMGWRGSVSDRFSDSELEDKVRLLADRASANMTSVEEIIALTWEIDSCDDLLRLHQLMVEASPLSLLS